MAEMETAIQKKKKMAYHMCLCPKNHLEADFKATFGLWRPPISTIRQLKCPHLTFHRTMILGERKRHSIPSSLSINIPSDLTVETFHLTKKSK